MALRESMANQNSDGGTRVIDVTAMDTVTVGQQGSPSNSRDSNGHSRQEIEEI
jgi:hypothetical protein